MGAHSKGEGSREVAPGGVHIAVKDQAPSFTHRHTPRFSSQAALSREALETPIDKLLDPACGARMCICGCCGYLSMGKGRGGAHLFAFGS